MRSFLHCEASVRKVALACAVLTHRAHPYNLLIGKALNANMVYVEHDLILHVSPLTNLTHAYQLCAVVST